MAKDIHMVVLKGTREAIVGTLVEASDEAVTLKSPRIVILQKDQTGNVGVQFVPYPFPLADYFLDGDWDEGTTDIKRDEMIIEYAEGKILPAVVKSYLEAISKVVIPEEARGQNTVSLK